MSLSNTVPDSISQRSLLRLPQVCALTGLSKAYVYSLIAAGHFPRSVRLGRRISAWDSLEINAWIAQRVAERDNATSR